MSKKSTISIVINTKNAAATLARTLESVHAWADEVVVVDMKSTDDTLKIAKRFKAKTFSFAKDEKYVEPARNFALEKAQGNWIFVIDADEAVPPSLRDFILEVVQGKSATIGDCYFVPRRNRIFGKWIEMSGWWPDYQLRFFRAGAVKWSTQIHTPPSTKGQTVYLPADPALALEHENYQSVTQFLERLNRYTSIDTTRNTAQTTTTAQVIHRFTADFCRRLFVERSIDEGVHGVSLAYLQGMYEVVAELKGWESRGFPSTKDDQALTISSLRQLEQSLNYWIADYMVKHTSGWRNVMWQFRRKLRI